MKNYLQKLQQEAGLAVFSLFGAIFIFAAVLSLLYSFFGKVVPPNAIGLRQNSFGIPFLVSEGFQPDGLAPGLHWQIPMVSEVHLLPRDFFFVHLSSREEEGGLRLNPLEIPTTDGSRVRTDITLVARLFEEPKTAPEQPATEELKSEKGVPLPPASVRSHGGPRELVNTYGLERSRQLSTFVKEAEDFLKRSLSDLSTIDYYNPVLREAAAIEANEAVNRQVNPAGIEAWATLIRRYLYAEKNIDDQIFAKNLQDQTERLNAALSALAEAKARTEETRATWDADIEVLRASGAAKARVLDAEGARTEQESYAEGNKLVALAVAEIEAQKNQALSAPGGKIFVTRKLLPILSTLSGGIVSQQDPFDVSAWLEKLGAGQTKEGAAQP